MRKWLWRGLRALQILAALMVISLLVYLGWRKHQSENVLEAALNEARSISLPQPPTETVGPALPEEEFAKMAKIAEEMEALKRKSRIPLEYFQGGDVGKAAQTFPWATAKQPKLNLERKDRKPGPEWSDLRREVDLALQPLNHLGDPEGRLYRSDSTDPRKFNWKPGMVSDKINRGFMLKALMLVRDNPGAIPDAIQNARKLEHSLLSPYSTTDLSRRFANLERESVVVEQTLLVPKIEKELLEKLSSLAPERDLIYEAACVDAYDFAWFTNPKNLNELRRDFRSTAWEATNYGSASINWKSRAWWILYDQLQFGRDAALAISNLVQVNKLIGIAWKKRILAHADDERAFQKVPAGIYGYYYPNEDYPLAEGTSGCQYYMRSLFAVQTVYDQMRLALALESYRTSKKQYPEYLQQLVPEYIATIPKDLGDGQDMKYRREGSRFVIYSIGIDSKDDGGKREPRPLAGRRVAEKDIVWPRIENTP